MPTAPTVRGGWSSATCYAYRRTWYVFLSGFFEPVLFLLSIGVGVGALVGSIKVGGESVSYKEFVAPGLLASAAMIGALLDTTFNFFIKYKYSHTYDAIVATPVGRGRHRDRRDRVGADPRRDLLRRRSW